MIPGLSVGFLEAGSFQKLGGYFHFISPNITLRTDLLTFGVTSAVFKIAGEMCRLPAYFDNPVIHCMCSSKLTKFFVLLTQLQCTKCCEKYFQTFER